MRQLFPTQRFFLNAVRRSVLANGVAGDGEVVKVALVERGSVDGSVSKK